MALQVIEEDSRKKTCIQTIKSYFSHTLTFTEKRHSRLPKVLLQGPVNPSEAGRSVPWDGAVPVTLDTGYRPVSRHAGH